MPIDTRRPSAVALWGLAALTGVAVAVGTAHYRFFDMVIYHDALTWWLRGGDLYAYAAPVQGQLGFTYPPFAAFALLPVTGLTAVTAGWLNVAAGVAALALVLAVVTAPLADRLGRSRASVLAVATPLALCTEPVRQTLGLGQVNLLLFALVALDLLVLGRRGSAWAGAGVGLATAIKLTPGLFIVYLLVTRQWRAARTAIVTVAALTGCGFLLAPGESARYFGTLLWQTGRVGAADATANQSLTGLLARAAGSAVAPAGWWLPLALLVLLLGLHRAGQAHRAGAEVTALTLTGLTANLVSPMSWTHHLVFLPVAVIVLADRAIRGRDRLTGLAAAGVWLLSVVSPIWLTPPGATGAAALLGRNAFVLLLIVLVAALPVAPARAYERSPVM
jgi:alpha-1,2-mannosyltransferase